MGKTIKLIGLSNLARSHAQERDLSTFKTGVSKAVRYYFQFRTGNKHFMSSCIGPYTAVKRDICCMGNYWCSLQILFNFVCRSRRMRPTIIIIITNHTHALFLSFFLSFFLIHTYEYTQTYTRTHTSIDLYVNQSIDVSLSLSLFLSLSLSLSHTHTHKHRLIRGVFNKFPDFFCTGI